MQFKNMLMFAVLMSGMTNMAYADMTQTSEIDEINAASCMVASQGVYTAAVERQAGSDKKKAKKALDKELRNIKKSFKNKEFVNFVETSWNNGLDIVYNMPVQTTDADKKAFIEQTTQAALISCMDDLQR